MKWRMRFSVSDLFRWTLIAAIASDMSVRFDFNISSSVRSAFSGDIRLARMGRIDSVYMPQGASPESAMAPMARPGQCAWPRMQPRLPATAGPV